MKDLKIAFVWTPWDIQQTVIFSLIKRLSKKNITISAPHKADLVIYGCYNWDSKLFHLYKILKSRIKNIKINEFIRRYEMKLVNSSFFDREYKPVTLYYSQEPLSVDYIKTDFSITYHLGILKENHLRYLDWKETCDWSSEGIIRQLNSTATLFGKYFLIDDLLKPQGDEFLKKGKKICFFTSHLNEPRRTFYQELSKNFIVEGYGRAFRKIKNTFSSGVTKFEVMKNYSFDLCPENTIYPGFINARVAEAFIGKCLPITWADQNINYEFNPKAFVNLNDHFQDNFISIIHNLKDDNFLRQFTKEPLLLKRPNLEKEIKFVEKILSCL
jgi:hypothetical protein